MLARVAQRNRAASFYLAGCGFDSCHGRDERKTQMHDDDENDGNIFSQLFGNPEELQAEYAKAQGQLIEAIDKQYAFIDDLDYEHLDMFMKTMRNIASGHDPTIESFVILSQFEEFNKIIAAMVSSTDSVKHNIAASWAGYARAIRYKVFGANPNPLVPKVSDEDFEEFASPDEN